MNKYYKLILSAVISCAGLYFAFHGENIEELVHQLRQVHWLPFWISVFLLLFSCLVRALRWQYILAPVEQIPLHPLFGSVMVGYFGNNYLFAWVNCCGHIQSHPGLQFRFPRLLVL